MDFVVSVVGSVVVSVASASKWGSYQGVQSRYRGVGVIPPTSDSCVEVAWRLHGGCMPVVVSVAQISKMNLKLDSFVPKK